MTLQSQSIDIKNIYLDPENPRHESLPNEQAIIRHLLAKDEIRNLAKDIAATGSTSPIELMALVKHDKVKNGYYVVEGNRRVCALKLLDDPDKAGSNKDSQYFSSLAKNIQQPITKVAAVVFETREQAQRWVALRHSGEQKGIGTKAWNSKQKSRFSLKTRGSDVNSQAVLAIEYAREKNLLSNSQLDNIGITTITRFLSNPVMRNALGLCNGNDLLIQVPTHEFDRSVTRLLTDSLSPEKTGVSSRSKAEERKNYAQKLMQEGVAATQYGFAPHEPGSPESPKPTTTPSSVPQMEEESQSNPESNASTSNPTETTTRGRNNQHPDKRTYVISGSFKAKISDKTLRRLFHELKTLDAKTFSFAATHLLRAVLEKSASLYLSAKGIEPQEKLNKKADQLAALLQEEGMTSRDLKYLRTIAHSHRDSLESPDTLGHYIHGGAVPSPSYVFRYWDNLEIVMSYVLNRV